MKEGKEGRDTADDATKTGIESRKVSKEAGMYMYYNESIYQEYPHGAYVYEGRRVGSSFVVHDKSSLALGAARAYEFDEVKRVNANFFCKAREVSSQKQS